MFTKLNYSWHDADCGLTLFDAISSGHSSIAMIRRNILKLQGVYLFWAMMKITIKYDNGTIIIDSMTSFILLHVCLLYAFIEHIVCIAIRLYPLLVALAVILRHIDPSKVFMHLRIFVQLIQPFVHRLKRMSLHLILSCAQVILLNMDTQFQFRFGSL